MTERFKIMIVAGEPSGDAHASALVKALRELAPNTQFEFFGATGPLMRAAGVETAVNSDPLAIMGIVEVGTVFPRFVRAFRSLRRTAISRRPDAVVLVDWPEFNLRLAASLHRQGIRVIYYISPQLWAWRPRRVKNIKRDVDLLLSILPFEVEWYENKGVSHTKFVGHPLVGEVTRFDRTEFCDRNNLNPAKPIISLLPGSRHQELERILPPLLDAIEVISRQRADIQFVIGVAPSRSVEETEEIIRRNQRSLDRQRIRIIHGHTREALAASDAAAIASGTATLEAALLSTPMVIVYKESAINWHTLGRLITSPYYGLVNLVAGNETVKELMQDDLSGERVASEVLRLLDPATNKAMRQSLREVSAKLGPPGASVRAAECILRFLTPRTPRRTEVS
jgi:lipid-A-disaccharide synthase